MGQGHLHSLKDLATPLKGQVGNQFHQPIFKDYHFLPLILLSFFPNFHMPHISFSSTLLSYAPIFLFYSLHSETSLSFLSFFIPNLTPWFQNPKMIYKPKKNKKFFSFYILNAWTLLRQSTEWHQAQTAHWSHFPAAKRTTLQRSTVSSTPRSSSYSSQIARLF